MRSGLCSLLVLGACIGDDDGGKSDGGGGDGAANAASAGGGRAVEHLVDAYCDLFARCCASAFAQIGGRARCEASFDGVSLFAALRAGTAVVVEPAFATCLAAMRRNGETCGQPLADTSSCATAFMGTRAEGEPCEEAVECVRDDRLTLCLKTGDPAGSEPRHGTCHALARAGLGEPCQFSSQARLYANHVTPAGAAPLLGFCDRFEGLRCDASRTCVPLTGAGGACRGHFECAQGLYCDQTCRPLQPEGGTCAQTVECENGLLCQAGRCMRFTAAGAMCSGAGVVPPVL